MAKWYDKYLSIYGKSCGEIPKDVFDTINSQLTVRQSAEPLISIVVIAYNEERRLAACLWSLSELSSQYPIEILGVNNNSKDRTEQAYQRLGLPYFNESKQSPGFTYPCGLEYTMALSLKPFNKIVFLFHRMACPVTDYGTFGSQSLWQSCVQHDKIQDKGLSYIFFKNEHYEGGDEITVKPIR